MVKESSKPVILLILSALRWRTVPTGIFIFKKVDVTESINLCEFKEEEKNKLQSRKNANKRRIKIYLKINLPAIKTGSNRTKVCNAGFAIEQKLLRDVDY